MALGVDLFSMAADGTIQWRWMCRFWKGHNVLNLGAPAPSEPPPFWEGPITREQIEALRARAGGREEERKFREGRAVWNVRPDEDLDQLLERPVHADRACRGVGLRLMHGAATARMVTFLIMFSR